MTKRPPLCRYCGKPIARETRRVWLIPGPLSDYQQSGDRISRYLSVTPRPRTREACTKLTNLQVVSLGKGHDGSILWFNEWDGTSYQSTWFCTKKCAERMAYALMREFPGRGTPAYHEAMNARASR